MIFLVEVKFKALGQFVHNVIPPVGVCESHEKEEQVQHVEERIDPYGQSIVPPIELRFLSLTINQFIKSHRHKGQQYGCYDKRSPRQLRSV